MGRGPHECNENNKSSNNNNSSKWQQQERNNNSWRRTSDGGPTKVLQNNEKKKYSDNIKLKQATDTKVNMFKTKKGRRPANINENNKSASIRGKKNVWYGERKEEPQILRK